MLVEQLLIWLFGPFALCNHAQTRALPFQEVERIGGGMLEPDSISDWHAHVPTSNTRRHALRSRSG